MPRLGRTAVAAAGCLVLLSFGVHALQQAPQDASIRWHTDKRKAFDEARRTGRPLWVMFR